MAWGFGMAIHDTLSHNDKATNLEEGLKLRLEQWPNGEARRLIGALTLMALPTIFTFYQIVGAMTQAAIIAAQDAGVSDFLAKLPIFPQ